MKKFKYSLETVYQFKLQVLDKVKEEYAIKQQEVLNQQSLINRLQERRTECQPLAVRAVRHPATALLVQHAAQLRGEKAVDTPGITADECRQHRQ